MDKEAKKPQSQAEQQADPQKSRQAMKESLKLLKKLGSGAGGLIARLRKTKSPQEMIEELESAQKINQKKRAEISSRLEDLYNVIASGKKNLASAAPARRRIIEMELKAKLKEYQAKERTLGILLENEQTLSLVLGRMEEVQVYGLSGINEDFIDNVADQLDEAADDAEDRLDATRDLERAGRRRERDSGDEDLMAALEGFGDPEESSPYSTEDQDPTAAPSETNKKQKDPLADFDE